MLFYCQRCGRIVDRDDKFNRPCDYCNNSLLVVPDEYLSEDKVLIPLNIEEEFIEKYIKSSPEFDQHLFNSRPKCMALANSIPVTTSTNAVTCPYCQSTNVSKISTLGRSISIGFFGLASGKVGKQWHCNNCKSDF